MAGLTAAQGAGMTVAGLRIDTYITNKSMLESASFLLKGYADTLGSAYNSMLMLLRNLR